MVNDALRQLFSDATLSAGTNSFVQNGSDINIGRGGLNSKSQLVAYVQTADGDRDLTFNLYLSLNDSKYRLIAALTVAADHAGKRVMNIGRSIPWGEWVDTEIKVRCSVTATDHTNNGDWNIVTAYLGEGEEEVYGRQPGTSDALVDA